MSSTLSYEIVGVEWLYSSDTSCIVMIYSRVHRMYTTSCSMIGLQGFVVVCFVLVRFSLAGDHFINKWAVLVPDGNSAADDLAKEHGFHNEGQVINWK